MPISSRTAVALLSATTRIDVSAATAPSANQVLTATSDTAATWQTPTAAASDWTALGACTYEGADAPVYTISFASDMTATLTAGMRIKLTDSTVKYFIIHAVGAYSGGKTITTVYGGTDYTLSGGAITKPYYSIAKAPVGFPLSPAKWKVRVTDSTDRSQASAVANTWYNLGTTASQISFPIGVWDFFYQVTVQQSTAAAVGVFVTLSTANNSESDTELTCNLQTNFAFGGGTVYRRKTMAIAAKATHYLNTMTTNSGSPTLYNRNGVGNGAPMIMEAIDCYL